MKKPLLILGLLLMALTMSSCGYNVPSDMVAVRIGAGPFEAKKVKDCVEPSQRGFFTNDTYAYFPTSEREWDATGQNGSDASRFKSVTKDSVEMLIPVTVRFTLKTDCDTIKDFYTRYARRSGVEFKTDGTYNAAWGTLLRKLVADPADATLDRIIQDYSWRKVWNDPATKVEIEKRFNESLAADDSLLVQTAKASYFEGVSVLVGKPEPANEALSEAVALEQTKVAEAQSAEAQARADAAKSRAQVAVSRAEAIKQRAVIAGFGSTDAYLRWLAVTNGINPWQPTYLYGGTPQGEGAK